MVDERNDTREVAPATQLPPAELVKEFEAQLLSRGMAQPQARTAVKVFESLTYKSHRGPLPPAEEFAGYEAVFRGAAKEILDMAVRQQQHAHWCEKAALQGEMNYRLFGMAAAIGVVLVLVGGAVICAIYGQTAAAVALGGAAGLATLAGAFIKGRQLFEIDTEKSAAPQPRKKTPQRKK